MKRKHEVIGIVINTEKEAEKCSFLSAVLDCKIENFAKITDFFLGQTVRKLSQAVIRKHKIESPPKGMFHIDTVVH